MAVALLRDLLERSLDHFHGRLLANCTLVVRRVKGWLLMELNLELHLKCPVFHQLHPCSDRAPVLVPVLPEQNSQVQAWIVPTNVWRHNKHLDSQKNLSLSLLLHFLLYTSDGDHTDSLRVAKQLPNHVCNFRYSVYGDHSGDG